MTEVMVSSSSLATPYDEQPAGAPEGQTNINIHLFRNGDIENTASVLAIDLDAVESIKQLLDHISSSFSNVDRMYEIPSGVRISHPSDLREGQSYAVAPREKYAAVEYKVPNAGPVVKFRVMRIHAQSISNSRMVTLTSRQMITMSSVRSEIAKVMGMLNVFEIYTFNGHLVSDVTQVQEGKLYYALRDDESFTPRANFDNASKSPLTLPPISNVNSPMLPRVQPPGTGLLTRPVEFPRLRKPEKTMRLPQIGRASEDQQLSPATSDTRLSKMLTKKTAFELQVQDIIDFMMSDESDLPTMTHIARTRFLSVFTSAVNGELSSWESNEMPLLALIMLVDQFPRILFPDSTQCYQYDHLSRAIIRRAIKTGIIHRLSNEHFFFVCLALSRQEDLECQKLCNSLWDVRIFDPVDEAHLIGMKKSFELSLRTIEKFGRFPQYNQDLGRASTRAEKKFLATAIL